MTITLEGKQLSNYMSDDLLYGFFEGIAKDLVACF